jgi:ABC-2 type transport system permease protein
VRLLWRDTRVRWIGAVLVLLMAVTGLGAWQAARDYGAEVARVTAAERVRWLRQDAKNPHSADHYGLWVFRPSSPLSVLDPGTEPQTGRMVRIEAHLFNDAVYRAVQDAGPFDRAGLSDVSDIVGLVVPLVALLLGFAAFAADRERGTLRLALGNGAPPGPLFAARFTALTLVLVALVGLPLLALGGWAFATLVTEGWQPWPRLLAWVAVQAVYATVFLLVAMLASLVASTARGALTISLVVWVALCLVAPRLATAGLETISPAPSYRETRQRIDADLRPHRSAESGDARAQEALARYGVSDPKELPVDLRGLMMVENDYHAFAVYDRELGGFFAALAAREAAFGWAGLLSPRIALQRVSEALAGTDFAQHAHFVWSAEAYRGGSRSA